MTELTPVETESPGAGTAGTAGYGKTISHLIIGLKTAKGTKQVMLTAAVPKLFIWTLKLKP